MAHTTILLADDLVHAEVVQEPGGATGRFDYNTSSGPVPIFRTGPGDGRAGPFESGSIVLVPYANRITNGGFSTPGGICGLTTIVEGEPYPIHGNGFQSRWSVWPRQANAASLHLNSSGPGLFEYKAVLHYRLQTGALHMEIEVANPGDQRLPFGIGFHPWFARESGSLLQFGARGVWLRPPANLPCATRMPTGTGFWNRL